MIAGNSAFSSTSGNVRSNDKSTEACEKVTGVGGANTLAERCWNERIVQSLRKTVGTSSCKV